MYSCIDYTQKKPFSTLIRTGFMEISTAHM